jgi:hypothetical protein
MCAQASRQSPMLLRPIFSHGTLRCLLAMRDLVSLDLEDLICA